MVEGCVLSSDEQIHASSEMKWTTILPRMKLKPDHKHTFDKEIMSKNAFTHVRLSIFPDGGVSRMRVWGRIKR
jgi:allantoicase